MNTFLYAFNQYIGLDRILLLKDTSEELMPGDLVQNGDSYYLVLGSSVSFQELYTAVFSGDSHFSILYKSLLSQKTINFIHRMVYEWYTIYKNVVKLFLDQEIDKLLMKEIKPKKTQKSYYCKVGNYVIQGDGTYQSLVVFPDLWSFANLVDLPNYGGLFLSSMDTQNKKNLNRRKIKLGSEKLISATSSEIFQDYNTLKKIYFIEPQKWYYSSQQDPRYKVSSVIKKLAELYGAEIFYINSEDLYK